MSRSPPTPPRDLGPGHLFEYFEVSRNLKVRICLRMGLANRPIFHWAIGEAEFDAGIKKIVGMHDKPVIFEQHDRISRRLKAAGYGIRIREIEPALVGSASTGQDEE